MARESSAKGRESKPWGAHVDKVNEESLVDTERKKVEMEIAEGIKAEVEWLNSVMDQFETDNKSRTAQGVVFLSSAARRYFPEDPGTSRFGVAYSMMKAPGDVPNPNYLPPDNRMEKPAIISTRGYGIGGLLGPRFAKDLFENNPAPNAYNLLPEIPQPPKRKSQLLNDLSKKATTTTIVTQTPHHNDDEKKLSLEDDLLDAQTLASSANQSKLNKAQLRNLCMQTLIGFGSHLSVTRFGTEPKWHNVGVGYYDLRKKEGEIRKSCSFGQNPVRLIPPAWTRCNYRGPDKCFECGEILRTVDYYRTSIKIKNPFYKIKPADRIKDEDYGFHDDPDEENGESDWLMERKNVYLSLCRQCYCRGLRGQSQFWDKSDMTKIFVKCRHCNYIHDHQSIPIFTHKTNCSFIRKLSRKEVLLSKYYKDACDRVLKSR